MSDYPTALELSRRYQKPAVDATVTWTGEGYARRFTVTPTFWPHGELRGAAETVEHITDYLEWHQPKQEGP